MAAQTAGSGIKLTRVPTQTPYRRDDPRRWFIIEGDTLLFNTWHTTVKAKNIAHEPRVSLTVDDENPPYAFVLVGADRAEAFGRRKNVGG
ncbi:MAG: hypothetical protein GYB64_16280 [Chloroflexi bacterium]|nr:hypothetical protein [Chloroflexota bacterium]